MTVLAQALCDLNSMGNRYHSSPVNLSRALDWPGVRVILGTQTELVSLLAGCLE